jgi:hypothetical protein
VRRALQKHVDGQLNPWVLELARCKQLESSDDSLGPMMESANLSIEDADKKISRARPHFCLHKHTRHTCFWQGTLVSWRWHTGIASSWSGSMHESAFACGAEANIVLPIVKPGSDKIPPLCVPFAKTNGMWGINKKTEPGCTELERAQVKGAYSKFVCDRNVPDIAKPLSAEYKVRTQALYGFPKHMLIVRNVSCTATQRARTAHYVRSLRVESSHTH